jgi:Protein of unknown function (DUF669)
MALLPDVFVPEDAEDNPFGVLDAGWYEAEITKSEMKITNDKEGKYLALTFKITEGEKQGRFVFANLNLVNKSDVAVKIARSDLKKICNAVGLPGDLEDSVDLHNIPMKVLVSVKPATAQWPEKNELKDFKDVNFDPYSEDLVS